MALCDMPPTWHALSTQVEQVISSLGQLEQYKMLPWEQSQAAYQAVIEKTNRILGHLDESHHQILCYPLQPTGVKALYPNVYLRTKPEPFVDAYMSQLSAEERQYDKDIHDALLLFE